MNNTIFGGLDSDGRDEFISFLFPPSSLTEGSDHSCKIYRREIDFSSREWWLQAAKELTYNRHYSCGCEHDCCGCFVGQDCRVIDEGHSIYIELRRQFNY